MPSKTLLIMFAITIPSLLLIWWFYGTAKDYRMASVTPSACQFSFQLTDGAEKKPGGALYTGALPKTMKDMSTINAMEGAHHIHTAQNGGELFMSKNKINHLETVYSEACGLRVIFYNAFTEPIRVERFQAVALLVPDGSGKPYSGVTFLKPSADGKMLQGWVHQDVSELIGAELHVKTPEDDEPEMFDIYLGDIADAMGH